MSMVALCRLRKAVDDAPHQRNNEWPQRQQDRQDNEQRYDGLSVGSVTVNSGAIQTITDLPIAEKLAIQRLERVFLEKI